MEDVFGHSFGIRENICIRKTQDPVTDQFKEVGAFRVVLYCLKLAMLPTVEFDHDLGAMAGEIGDVRSDGYLLAKMQTRVFGMTQGAP